MLPGHWLFCGKVSLLICGEEGKEVDPESGVRACLGLLTLQLSCWWAELHSVLMLQPAPRLPFGSFGGARGNQVKELIWIKK